MSSLKIKLLGKPQIWLDDSPLDQLVSAKAKATFYYLAATRTAASRELLAGLLWSDMPDSAARASLRVVLSKLRSQLDPFLVINRREAALNLNAADVHVDIDFFVADNHQSKRQAIESYSGPFLDDFNLRDAPLFMEWVAHERRSYHQKAIRYLSQQAKVEAENGDISQSIQDWRELLNLEPWNEKAHRDLMRLLAENGQRAAALSQFEQCQQRLRDGLDIDPSAETVAIYKQIKASGIAKGLERKPVGSTQDLKVDDKSTPHNLPKESLSFIGRELELQKVIDLLAGDQCSLLTITGTGGIGKTRLANECGHQLLARFEDGVFLAPLVGTSSADLLPTAVAAAVGLALQGQKTPQDQLFGYLSTKKLLLILDNFEHLLEGISFLTDLISAVPNLKILVTSREPLGMGSEWVLPLIGLPHAADLDQPAAQLFTTRAQRLDLSFAPEKEAAEIGRICQMVEGMPLAIELASAWVRVISCHEIAAEIESNLDFLATDLDLVPAHQRSIRAVFGYSWSLLPEEAQSGFAKLSIFRGGFTRESAEKVAGVTLRTLTTLVDKSLLQKEAGGRFHIHPLLRQFGLEQLPSTEKEATSLSYVNFFALLLDQYRPDMYSSKDPDLLKAVQNEIENIRAVWDWLSLNRGFEMAIQQLLPVTSYYFQRRNLFYEGLALFENILVGDGEWTPEINAQVLIQAASFDSRLGRYDACENRLNEAVPILQQADQIEYAAEGLYYLGIVYCRRGEYQKALKRLNESHSIYLAFDDELGCARSTNVMGIVAASEGNYSESERHYRAALTVYQKYGYQKEISNLLSNLGSVYGRKGQYEEALSHYQASANIAKRVNETMATAVVLSNLGSVSRALKKYDDAVGYYEESLLLTKEIGDQRWIAANYNGLGLTFVDLEQPKVAVSYLKQGFSTALAIHALPDALTALTHLGSIAIKLGQVKVAAIWLTFAVNQAETPAIVRRDAEESLAAITDNLTKLDQQEIIRLVKNWHFQAVRLSIESTFN